jgi:mono/diheme cytochrome c family protein
MPPRPVTYVLLVLIALSFVPMAFLVKARVTGSTSPRLQIIPDMDNQPRFKSQQANPLFADNRELRPPVPGTVACTGHSDDPLFSQGRTQQGEWTARSPLPTTAPLLQRGQQRFQIYCTPCHGLGGAGDGTISRRADRLAEGTWTPPSDLASETVRERPDGHLFNTITHGIRNMPAYGPQISPADRWAIVAYVRALQRARHATLDDVPPDVRPTLK